MGMEYRYCELRADFPERRLEGVAMKYGSIGQIGHLRERFEAGAFGDLATADVILNKQHVRGEPLARTNGGGLVLTDTNMELKISAILPETRAADDVLTLIKTSVLRGLSIEFRATRERMESGVRVVSRAVLRGIGVVDAGAYRESIVAARAADLAGIRQPVPYWVF